MTPTVLRFHNVTSWKEKPRLENLEEEEEAGAYLQGRDKQNCTEKDNQWVEKS